jgi:hypothetical protein
LPLPPRPLPPSGPTGPVTWEKRRTSSVRTCGQAGGRAAAQVGECLCCWSLCCWSLCCAQKLGPKLAGGQPGAGPGPQQGQLNRRSSAAKEPPALHRALPVCIGRCRCA